MSIKAARGTKRVCQSCSSKFYDLNRNPITCPICNAVFQDNEARPKAALPSTPADDEDDEALETSSSAVEVVSLEEVAENENENEDIPDLEDNDISIEEESEDLGQSDETFIEVEEDDSDDEVSGIVSGGSREDEEEA